jgi:hypothetical protein
MLFATDRIDYFRAKDLLEKTASITENDPLLQEMTHHYLEERRKKAIREKYSLLLVAALTILICLLIFWAVG